MLPPPLSPHLIAALRADFPLINSLTALQPLRWFNPAIASSAEALGDVGLTQNDVDDASARLARFAPYLAKVFPETQASGGIIESPIVPLPAMQAALGVESGIIWLKQDSHLPMGDSMMP